MNTQHTTPRAAHLRAVPAQRSDARPTPATHRTPYHALGSEQQLRIPAWAQHRAVYRTSGRTLYLVETDRLADAKRDLAHLDRAGWDVRISHPEIGDTARIALTRKDLARAA